MSADLPSYRTKVLRGLVSVALLNLFLSGAILLLARPALVERLAEEYLQGLGRYVARDIRYVLLVQDPATTRAYVADLAGLPWIRGVRLLDRAGRPLEATGARNWVPPVGQYTTAGRVRTLGDEVHLTRRLVLDEQVPGGAADALLHVSLLGSGFAGMIDDVLALLIASIAAVTLALFLVSAAFARRAARLVTALSADMQAIDPERGVPEPIALDTGIREFDAVQRSFNALVERVGQRNEELERRIRARTGELTAALAQKERAEAVRSSLIMNLSHDLKTPLTANVGYLDHVLEELACPAPDLDVLRHAASRARASGRTLAEEVDTLLQYSISSGDLSRIAHRPLDVRALVERAVAGSAALQEASGNTLEVELRGRHSMVTVERLVRHVLDNLLSNAHRHCTNGHVVLRCAVDEALELIVADTGPGIPAAERERIFDPPGRPSSGGRVGPKGMGIGLALTKTWVDHLGGTLTLESGPWGTRFRVTIPETAPVG